MQKQKPSFFQRLTGGTSADDTYDDGYENAPQPQRAPAPHDHRTRHAPESHNEEWGDNEAVEGQLTVDVYQTPEDIVIRSIVAGVRPEDLDISISRDMVTIRGSREEHKEVTEDNYFLKELYWGSFSRTVLLPAEIEVEEAQASEKYGLLTVRLPKVDKERQTKLKVKSQ